MNPLQPRVDAAIVRIDKLASDYGMKFISTQSNYLVFEYNQASDEAAKWLLDETQECPKTVTAWASASKLSNHDAAEYIVQKANQFKQVVATIRDYRLAAKVSAREAIDVAQINEAINLLSDQLDALLNYKPLP